MGSLLQPRLTPLAYQDGGQYQRADQGQQPQRERRRFSRLTADKRIDARGRRPYPQD